MLCSRVQPQKALFSPNTVSQALTPHTLKCMFICKCFCVQCPNKGAPCSKYCLSKYKSNKTQQAVKAVTSRPTGGRHTTTYSTGGQSAVSTTSPVARVRSLPMGRKNCCYGLPVTVLRPATSLPLCSKHSCNKRSSSRAEGGNTHFAEQKCNTSGSDFGGEQRLVQPLFRCPEERGGTTSDPRPACIKQIPAVLQVQNADTQTATERCQYGRLVCDDRSNRRILPCSDPPAPQQFLRFAFEGTAYEYLVLPFGLSLAPRTFSKCVEAALAPLREKGVRILAYLDDWALVASSKEQAAVQLSLVLSHIQTLGFSVNERKSSLYPSQQFSFLGLEICSVSGRACLSEHRVTAFLPCLAQFQLGHRLFSDSFEAVAHDGIYDRGSAARTVKDANVSTLDSVSSAVHAASSSTNAGDNPVLYVSSPPMEGSRSTESRFRDREGDFSQSVVHGCLPQRVGGSVRQCRGERGLVGGSKPTSHQPLGNASSVFSPKAFLSSFDRPACPDQDRQHNCGFIHKQAGRDPLTSSVKTVSLSVTMVQCAFSVSQSHPYPRSFEPRGRPSFQGRASSEGMEVASSSGGSDMGALRQGGSRPLCLQVEHPLPLVLFHDGSERASGNGCASSSMAEHSPICVSSCGDDIAYSGEGAPAGAVPDTGGASVAIEVVVCRDDQPVDGEAVASSSHQQPSFPGRGGGNSSTPRTVASPCLPVERSNLIAKGLPPSVVETIQSARASSTRGLYAYNWRAFEQWCEDQNVLPFQCSIVDVLTFLQGLLDKGLSFSTIKVYLAAISACHIGFDGVKPGAHPLAVRFLKGVRRLRPVVKSSIPSWDLILVLEALCGPPFEPIESVDMKFVSFKTALLLALTSAKRVGDLHALSVHSSCTQFTLDGSKVTLRPNEAYLPKVIPAAYNSMTFELSSFCPPPFASEELRRLHCLCPVRMLRTYIDRTQGVRLCDQLFVCFANPARGKALSKQRLSHWIVEAISLAYSSRGLPLPQGVRAHSTRGMATSWALFRGVSVTDICAAASWSSPHTFVRFYRLDVTAPSVAHSVLSAGSVMH